MAKVDQIRAKAAEYFQKGEYEKAVAEYTKVLELEPGNASTYNFIGDAYVKVNNINDAVANYLEAAKGYSTDALFNNAIAVCKKILRVKKDDPEVYKTLGELYIQQGLINEAITNLLEYADRKVKDGKVDAAFPVYHQIVELNPRNLTIRAKLADMYLAQKRVPEAITELSEVAQGYRDQGRHIEAEALEAKVRGMKGESSPAPSAPAAAPPAGEISASSVIEELTQPKVDIQQPWAPSASAAPGAAPSMPEITIERELEKPAAAEPMKQDWTTNIELGDLLMEIGSTQEALDQYHTAANGFLGDGSTDRAVEVYKRIADIQPLELRSRQKLVEIGLQSGQTPAIIDAYLGLAECLRRRELKEQAAAIYQKVLELEPVNETALENLSLLLPELPEGSVEMPGMQVQADGTFAGLSDLTGSAPAAAPPAAPAELSPPIQLEPMPPSPAAPAAPWMAPPLAPEEENAAPDSFMIQAGQEDQPAAAPATAPEEGKVSWGREIVEGGRQSRVKFSMGEDTAPKAQEEFLSLNDILAEFKEGVYQNMSQEDFQGHYDLGIAYKEMGLLEEAIGEFQLASKGEKERLKSFEMLGLCFMERSEYKFAIKQFERGLATPGYGDEDYMGCRYNLGLSYEAIGDMENSFKAFESAYMVDVGFKDVAKRYQSMKSQMQAQPAAPAPAAAARPAAAPPQPALSRPQAPTPAPARPALVGARPSAGVPPRPVSPQPAFARPTPAAPSITRPQAVRPQAPGMAMPRPAPPPVQQPPAATPVRPATGRTQVSLADIQPGGVVMQSTDGGDGESTPKPKPIPSKLKKPEKQRISYV